MEGQVVVRYKDGEKALSKNVWELLMIWVGLQNHEVSLNDKRVFIDGEEVPKPIIFKVTTKEGG